VRVLLVAPTRRGGEGAYTKLIQEAAPAGVTYEITGGVHSGAPGAPCNVLAEVALNRFVRPRTIPDIEFRALHLRDSFDLVHVHAHPVRLAKLGRTPLVMSESSSSAVYLRDYLGWDAKRLGRRFGRTRRLYRALGVQDRLLALDRVTSAYVFSEWARDVNLRWGADPGKLEVVAPGLPEPLAVSRGQRDTYTFLFVGTDFERKGGFDLVDAFDLVSARHPRARLVLAGSDPRERNPDRLIHGWVGEARRNRGLSKLQDLERRGVVTCLGGVEPRRLDQEIYPGADAFVMPTLAEGFGFTNLEAMARSLPVVSSRVGPIPEIVADDRTGLLVPPGDVEALVEAMSRLVSDPDSGRAMGSAAREAFLRHYTLEHFRQRLGAVYRRALEA
jgi:glycosyltransferase involved in cell wall biosynthesis